MTTKRRKRRTTHLPDSVSNGLSYWMNQFLTSLKARNYSDATVEHYGYYIENFIQWCEQRSLHKPNEITKPIVERYQRHLFHFRDKNQKPLSFRVQSFRLIAIRMFFKWLTKQNVILYNPAGDIELPRKQKSLPKHVLTPQEADTVINQTDIHDTLGLRDRAIMETLYSTGMRRNELIHLSLYHLDPERGTVLIQQGKGGKDRYVPIGERALLWIDKYLTESRPKLAVEPDEGILFLSNMGDKFTPHRLTQLVGHYVKQAELTKKGACHLFRHTMATLMLENGADVRYIQHILGHEKISTTEIYTHVSIHKLKSVHSRTHPAAVAIPRESSDPNRDPEKELLSSLAAEALEENDEDE